MGRARQPTKDQPLSWVSGSPAETVGSQQRSWKTVPVPAAISAPQIPRRLEPSSFPSASPTETNILLLDNEPS